MAGKTISQLAQALSEPGQNVISWLSGRLDAVEEFQSTPREPLDYNENIYTFKGTRATAQTIPQNGDMTAFGTVVWDPSGMKITNYDYRIQVAGRYRIIAWLRWGTIPVGTKYQVAIWKNGNEIAGSSSYGDGSAGGERSSTSMEDVFAANDLIQVRAFHDNAAGRDVVEGALVIAWTGPPLA